MQRVELSRQMPGMTNPARYAAIVSIQDPHYAIHHIRDIEIFLLRVWREIDGAGGIVAAIIRHGKFLQEFALLCENLNPVAAAVADVDQPVI